MTDTPTERKIKALTILTGNKEITFEGGEIIGTFGGTVAAGLATTLDALGLKMKEGDYNVKDSKGGVVGINPNKLPDPGPNIAAYKTFEALSGLANEHFKKTGVDHKLVLHDKGEYEGKITGAFGGLQLVKLTADLNKLGLREGKNFTIEDDKAGVISFNPSTITLPVDAKFILENLEALENSTGVRWEFNQKDQAYKQSTALTKEQVSKLVALDNAPGTRPVFQVLLGTEVTGAELQALADKPTKKLYLEYKPEEMNAKLLQTLEKHQETIKGALGAGGDGKQTGKADAHLEALGTQMAASGVTLQEGTATPGFFAGNQGRRL